jgi:hypothetical protein
MIRSPFGSEMRACQPLSHQARWLFRTLHAAELAGLDPAEIIGSAIAARDLAGARDIAAVLDARIRPRVDPLLPRPQGLWAERVPHQLDPEHRAYLAEIAALMDDRTQRLGQHAAQTTPAWATTALGPEPDDAAARQDWERSASSIAAYREMYGYDHPGDPIGPEPARDTPDQRAACCQQISRFCAGSVVPLGSPVRQCQVASCQSSRRRADPAVLRPPAGRDLDGVPRRASGSAARRSFIACPRWFR